MSTRRNARVLSSYGADEPTAVVSILGYPVLVDREDEARVRAHRWYASRRSSGVYFFAKVRSETGGFHHVGLHRLIAGLVAGDRTHADHRNGNTLDNRRSNLRAATSAQNQWNRHAVKSASGFKGVTWHKGRRRWQAAIKVNGKFIYLGLFGSPQEAGTAYDAAARRYFGDFARPNEDSGA